MGIKKIERKEIFGPYAALWSTLFPEMPKSPAYVEAEFMMSVQGGHEENYLWEGNEGVDAVLTAWDPNATTPIERIQGEILALPSATESTLDEAVDRLFALTRSCGAQTLTVYSNSRSEPLFRRYEKCGGQLTQSIPVTRLDLAAPIPDWLQEKALATRQSGIEIVTAVDLEARGWDWLPAHRESSREMLQDMPGPHEPPPIPLEQLREMFANTLVYPRDSLFFALDGERIVGYSRLTPSDVSADIAMTGLSGVVRSHRRRGIVTAIKVETIRRLAARGFRWLITDNDETNPMYDLNLAFGFQPIFKWLCFDWDRASLG